MRVKTYYVSKVGDVKISKNFRVKEFQCKDGTDKVLIDDDLVYKLQLIRDHFDKPLIITSGYRTPSYNAKVGGSPTSKHVKGMACDIRVNGIDPVLVGMYAESIDSGGIGVYSYVNGFTHIDTRTTPYRWLQLTRTGGYEGLPKIMPTLGKNRSNIYSAVKLLQSKLDISQSGTFGDYTESQVMKFQYAKGLTVDGLVGKATWTALFS